MDVDLCRYTHSLLGLALTGWVLCAIVTVLLVQAMNAIERYCGRGRK